MFFCDVTSDTSPFGGVSLDPDGRIVGLGWEVMVWGDGDLSLLDVDDELSLLDNSLERRLFNLVCQM